LTASGRTNDHRGMPNTCRCGIADWRALRLALRQSQADLARAIYCARWTVIRAEAREHHCPRDGTIRCLHDLLHRPDVAERLATAGYDPYRRGETAVGPAAPAHELRPDPLAVLRTEQAGTR
jgi:hypothetical protein